MKRVILIPAYNPEDDLINLLKKVDKEYDVVVVNDGSTNKYVFDNISDFCHVISYKQNKGKGYALKQGLKYIKDNYKNYVVVTMDADGQHELADAYKLCDYVCGHDKTLVLGRRHWNYKSPLSNRLGNKITRFVFKKKTGLSIYDTQSGLRAFSNKLTDYMLGIHGNRYEYEMNVLLNLKKNNISFYEIDIKTIYKDGNKSSHFKAIKDSYKIYKEIINFKG